MKNNLPSGSFLPSGLLEMEGVNDIAFNSTFNNFSLKAGIVTRTHEMEDDSNISKEIPEYDVVVIEQRSNDAQVPITYKNCIPQDMFGGLADFMEFKLRSQEKVDKAKNKGRGKIPSLQDGSIVLILCINGFNENAVIVGGMKQPKRRSKLTKDKGHALVSEFNGMGLEVDKDGALTISFKGATSHDGKAKDSKVGGSFIKIKKDGSVEMSDGKKERISFDKTKESTELQSGKDMKVDAGAKLDMAIGDAMNVKIAAKMVLEAQGSASLTVGSLKVESKGAAEIKASSVDIQSDGMVKIKGSQITLDGLTFAGGPGGTPALLMTTMFIGVGNLGGPVVSQAVGPFSGKVFISS
jgi:hypothetical protein